MNRSIACLFAAVVAAAPSWAASVPVARLPVARVALNLPVVPVKLPAPAAQRRVELPHPVLPVAPAPTYAAPPVRDVKPRLDGLFDGTVVVTIPEVDLEREIGL